MTNNISSSIGDELPADCLLEIFSYLSFNDMLRIKNVCRKWYQVSQHWFKQVQSIVFTTDLSTRAKWELREKYIKRVICTGTNNYGRLRSILYSYGHHLKHYQIKYCTASKKGINERNEVMFLWAPELCKNIVDAKIIEYKSYPHSAYRKMATHWKKLEKLSIKYLSRKIGRDFLRLLYNNKQLKNISLVFEDKSDCPVNDKLFTYLTTTIEEIKIVFNSVHVEQLNDFISASKNFTSLRSLKFSSLHYLSDTVVMAIADIKSLVHLSLNRVGRYESRKTIDPIANLKGLKSLDLSFNRDLHENSFMNIVKNCTQLEQLEIHNCNMLTDKGMAAIAELEELKILSITATNVTSESIVKLPGSLEVLRCYSSEINDSDAIIFLKKKTNLRLVDFTFCNQLTEVMITGAEKISNEREKNILCITGSLRSFDSEGIDTPYFKYVEKFGFAPSELFSNYIKKYIKECIFREILDSE